MNQENNLLNRSQSLDFSPGQDRPLLPSDSNSGNTFQSRSIQRRTLDGARQIRDRISNVFREIEPLVETARTVNSGMQNAISISNFLNRSQSETEPTNSHSNNRALTPDNSGSIVINLDAYDLNNLENHNENNDNVVHINVNVNNENNNPPPTNEFNEEDNVERMQTLQETQQALVILLKYVPFILILVAKAVYDYHQSIFILIVLFVTFSHSNSTLKREVTKRNRRSLTVLSVELLYISTCSVFIFYVFEDDLYNFHIALNLVLLRSNRYPLTVWNLLWVVTVTDFILKLITVTIKILLTMLPEKVVDFKKRGKQYLFIEAFSQLYRSIATIQPWLYYLLESYQGPQKIVAVFLSAFYMISKGSDLMAKNKFIKNAFMKLLQNVSVGSSPSKDQIQTAGDQCPICHDSYDSPVLLACHHIFCENCVTTWFDREQTCPLCRAKIVDDPSWRDGSTTYFMQLY